MAAFACGAVHLLSAALPDYARHALNALETEIPAKWAYTITTQRDENSSVERYDPSKSGAEKWMLRQHNGAVPPEKDIEKYKRLKAANPAAVSQASFERRDIDPLSLKLVREDAERGEFEGSFRDTSTDADKMLGHLRLTLVINKANAYVEKYILDLIEPYSPVLGVKMHQLRAEMQFSAPTPEKPSLSAAFSSDFTGKIFFINKSEKLRIVYSDFISVN